MSKLPNYDPAEHTTRLQDLFMTRREMLQKTGMGMGALGLLMMLGERGLAFGATNTTPPAQGQTIPAIRSPLAPKKAPLPAKAKRVIHIWAPGGPSHVDTFDPKPVLEKYADQTLPGANGGLAFPSPFKFSKHGKSGLEMSELFSKLGECADDMCVIRSLWTDVPAHEPASRFMHTGSLQLPKPSIGSWVVYGLGTENQSLPGFISLGGKPDHRQASFLPSLYQGVNVNYSPGMPLNKVLLNISNQFERPEDQRRQLDLARQLDAIHSEKLHKEEQLEARIESFEMAFRMQTEAVEAFDITKESDKTRQMYGIGGGGFAGRGLGGGGGGRAGGGDAGAKLLVARRLIEKGVRFVQVPIGSWDHHSNIEQSLERNCASLDGAAAALLKDLKQRGMLEDTLVVWGGEFGRTVTRDRQGNGQPGRDHNGKAACCWMAGGGVKGGMAYGATDETGARAETNRVHVHDLHATILALLGFDHTKLTYRYNGRDFRLTDNFGTVVKDIIA